MPVSLRSLSQIADGDGHNAEEPTSRDDCIEFYLNELSFLFQPQSAEVPDFHVQRWKSAPGRGFPSIAMPRFTASTHDLVAALRQPQVQPVRKGSQFGG